MTKIALFPGTFEPPSQGHLDIIERASKICSKLYVAVGKNRSKGQEIFSLEEKVELLTLLTKSIPEVEVVSFDGLVVDFAKSHHVNFLVRGFRAYADFEYEIRMALANRKIGEIETVFLMADESLSHISSTLIREIASYGHRLHDFVPLEIEERVYNRLQSLYTRTNNGE